MLGRTHLALSLFLSSLFFSNYSFDVMSDLVLFSIFIIGSIFPDIDSKDSLIGRKVKLIPFLFKHRGFFHSIWSLIMFSLLLGLLIKPIAGIFFALGFSLHLLLDGISKEGIKIFNKKIKGPIRVGSIYEHLLYLVLLMLSLFFIL